MIKIAHEAPIPHIQFVQERTDFDFAIAHFALEYSAYAYAYARRSLNRILIMDNGKFELVNPLSISEVLRAADLTGANYVVAPDHFGDIERTKKSLDQFLEATDKMPWLGVAAVVVGNTPAELKDCYNYYTTIAEIDMYCWSFLTDRVSGIALSTIDVHKPHHLLGFSTKKELAETLIMLRHSLVLSIDTMKPVSAAYSGLALQDAGRGKYVRPDLTEKLDEELLGQNIDTFRSWLAEL